MCACTDDRNIRLVQLLACIFEKEEPQKQLFHIAVM